uniref:molybdopterin-dependent oxidoreductase n=1 Tax=Veillonella magna TaxID=464322 RepID=UPI00402AEC5F
MEVKHTSVCPYDCPDACGLVVTTENDRVIKVQGNPEHTFTRGTLCMKMQHYEETVHSPERLTTPLRRIGAKGEGRFTPITWEEAIEEIASRVHARSVAYGGESIMSYSYAGTMGLVQKAASNPLFAILGATRQDRGICSPAKSYGWQAVMGQTLGTRPQEMAHSDMVIFWGLDATSTNLHSLHDATAARKNGAKLWVIDTRQTVSFRQADHGIQLRPGTDSALALAVAHILVRDGLIDTEFVKEHVQGYEQFVEEILPGCTPQWAMQITGVEVADIEALAQAYGKARAPFIRLGSGLSRYGNGAMTVRCIVALPALVGAYARKGGGFLSSAGGSSFVGGHIMDWDRYAVKETRLVPMIRLGEALNEVGEKALHCLYIYSSNPAITSPNQNLVRRGLAREDLFTVVHERFMTDTARYADIVLPATTSLEHDDLYNSYGHYTIGCGWRAIAPVGESKSNWEVMRLLAGAMGIDHPVFTCSERELIAHMLADTILTEEEKEKIWQGQPVEMTLPEDYKMRFKTPSGKIELWTDRDEEPMPRYTTPHGDDAEFWLINGPDPRILDSSFNERVFISDGTLMKARMHPADMDKKKLRDGAKVVLYNDRGEVRMTLAADEAVLPGTVVSDGVWWQKYSSDDEHGINALTADRPTDRAWGSTFYDVKVNVRVDE